MTGFSRRDLALGLPALFAGNLVGGAQATPVRSKPAKPGRKLDIDPIYYDMYGEVRGEPFPIPAIDLSRIQPAFLRREVAYQTDEKPGTVIVDPNARYLYFVEEDGKAIRYGVGVGRQGFAWYGDAVIHYKLEWPKWFPPADMVARQPELKPFFTDGMPGGPGNPIGARGMYLFQGNIDTLYRIHGTVEPWTIGTRASSGCIRMINQDAIDLYSRVALGTKVVVVASPGEKNSLEAFEAKLKAKEALKTKPWKKPKTASAQ